MKLTDVFLRGLKAGSKEQKHSDGGGLYLYVSTAGGKLWRLAYRFDGKQKTLSFGAYPAVSLKDARQKREEAKALLARGIDPGTHKQNLKAAAKAKGTNSFEAVAREWFAKHSPGLAVSHSKKILARLEKHIFPIFGIKTVNEVEAADLLKVARHAEEQGAVETAHRLVQLCGQIFRYAIIIGRTKHDVSADLRGALQKMTVKHMATLTDKKRIGQLLRAIDSYTGFLSTKCALQLAPLVFVRPGELQKAEWAEFDFVAAEWRIPAAKMKIKQVHLVPLSSQALAVLNRLQPYTGSGRFLFPSTRTDAKPISEESLLVALRSMGFTKEEMTMHGFRGMASTLLNEQGYNRDWIERQLAHGERNSVRAAYNYAEYLPERRRMMQEWSDYLEKLKNDCALCCEVLPWKNRYFLRSR